MSKIAEYLNEHLIGEVTTSPAIRERFSKDASLLTIQPELVVFPRVTNDIRKVARFAWQLAEKGHVLSLTPRGYGSDQTGGAIGGGIIIETREHLADILYVATKDKHKIVHVQPGVTVETLNSTLQWHGLTLAGHPELPSRTTVGGAIAKATRGQSSSKYGTIADAVERLEVVLANGDLIETSRISRRELSKKKGLQTLEGEIYRQLDGLIDDNHELISKLSSDYDNTGYRIDKVKQKDGSIDLTPLFLGSQGTLGIISEAVLQTNFYNSDETVLVVTTESHEEARDIADTLRPLEPRSLELFDGDYYTSGHALGKSFIFDTEGRAVFRTLVYVSFDDFSERTRTRKLKKAIKLLSKRDVLTYTSDDYRIEELHALREIKQHLTMPSRADESLPPIGDGVYVPRERQEEFATAVAELAEKNHVSLPLHVNALDDIIYTRPLLRLKRVSDKQKVFKLLADYTALVYKTGGVLAGASAEGRINAFAAYQHVDEETRNLYDAIRKIFDPLGTLNPGVKQQPELKALVKQLRAEYDVANQI